MGFIGTILVFQAGLQTQRVVPDLTLLGAIVPRAPGARLRRVDRGAHARHPRRRRHRRRDRLDGGHRAGRRAAACARADPIDYLVKPRFFASIVMTTVLTIWSGAVAFVTGMITADTGVRRATPRRSGTSAWSRRRRHRRPHQMRRVRRRDPDGGGYCGLSTFGGSEGVGWATTRAVVNSSLAVIMLNFFIISSAGLVVFP